MANRFDDDGEPVNTDGATVQMSGEALARLHRELEKGAEAKRVSRTAATDERSAPPAAVAKPARGRQPVPAPVVVEEPEAEYEAEPEAEYEAEPEGGYEAEDPDAAYAQYGGEIEEADEEAALPTVKAGKPPKAAKPEKAPKPEKAAKPEKPPKPEKAPKPAKDVGKRAAPPAARGVIEVSQGGGGLCAVGGVGAIFIAIAVLIQALSSFGVLGGDDPDLVATMQLVALIAGVVGHILLFLGMLGAARATNGLAVLVGIFHLVTVLVTAFILLLVFGVVPLEDADLAQTIMLIAGLIGPTTWLLSGIWGFASSAGMGGGLAIPYGSLALLGGAGLVFTVIAPLMNGFDPELAGTIAGIASIAIFGAMVILTIAMFGPLRRGRT